MSLRAQFYLLALLFTVVFTPLGMSILDEKQHTSAAKLETYLETEGNITSAKKITKKRSGSSVYVTYNFLAANGRRYEGSASITTDDWRSVEQSLTMRVLYDPSTPQQNSLAKSIEDYADERPLALRASVGAIVGMPLGLAVAGLWVWFARRRQGPALGRPA